MRKDTLPISTELRAERPDDKIYFKCDWMSKAKWQTANGTQLRRTTRNYTKIYDFRIVWSLEFSVNSSKWPQYKEWHRSSIDLLSNAFVGSHILCVDWTVCANALFPKNRIKNKIKINWVSMGMNSGMFVFIDCWRKWRTNTMKWDKMLHHSPFAIRSMDRKCTMRHSSLFFRKFSIHHNGHTQTHTHKYKDTNGLFDFKLKFMLILHFRLRDPLCIEYLWRLQNFDLSKEINLF